jgi:hypothetical protein
MGSAFRRIACCICSTPFFTTKETGMGMGLPISQTIIENHNGEIWAESEPGIGTVFRALPFAVEREESAASATAAANKSRRWRRGCADVKRNSPSSSSMTTRPCAARCNG